MMIISGFPGIGKSSMFAKYGAEKVSDSDSSNFPKEQFPTNYLNHIKRMTQDREFVLVSSHAEVRAGLVECGMEFTLVYPDQSLKDEYVQRYISRGSPEAFVQLMSDNWDKFLEECRGQTGCNHIVLQAGQYLTDVV